MLKNKILVISEIGCGPPFLGNRARLRSLLTELQSLKFHIDFAGVNISNEEKVATIPFVDRWVFDFITLQYRSVWSRIICRLQGYLGIKAAIRSNHQELDSVDSRMNLEWMDQARCLQKREKYDIVLVEYVFHSAFLECFATDCLRILDTHDVFGERNKRLEALGITEKWFSTTQEGEKNGLSRADRVLAIQENEAHYFNNLLGSSKAIFTVGHITANEILPIPPGKQLTIGYLSSDNPLNLKSFEWFYNEVWMPFRNELEGVELLVGGRICQRLESFRDIKMFGEIESVRDFYLYTHLTINPMIVGTGLKIKTIESLAFGRPTIGTSVACEGLEKYIGRGIMLANSPEEFVRQIKCYLLDETKAQRDGADAAIVIDELNQSWRDQLRLAFTI